VGASALKQRVGLLAYRASLVFTRRVPRAVYRLSRAPHRRSYARSLDEVVTRDELPYVLNRRGLVGEAVEVGVKRGSYSEYLLRRWRGRRLVSVDPWLEAEAGEYVDRANVAQDEHERFYAETRDRLRRFGGRSEIWRLTSVEAAARVADASVDFVYIDARHDYESVQEDLAVWFPKVRAGGILAGHDYADGRLVQGDFGVKQAVDEFAAARGLRVHATAGRPTYVEMFPSWLIEVPSNEGSHPARSRPMPGP
jgi:predicted O-methyltransferase YrrM